MAITFSRKGRSRHRRRQGKTCRERSLVDYRRAAGPTSTCSNAGASLNNETKKRQKNALGTSSGVPDIRLSLPALESQETEDDVIVHFRLRRKSNENRSDGFSILFSQGRPKHGGTNDGSSISEEDVSVRELRSINQRGSAALSFKCDSWASPSPSPCSVVSSLPTLTPRRSIIRSHSRDSIGSSDSTGSSMIDLPSLHGLYHDFRSPVRSPRRRLAIPLTSFSDDGLNLILKMHEELREVTAQAEKVRRERYERLPKRSKSRQRKTKEIHNELTKIIAPRVPMSALVDSITPATSPTAPFKPKARNSLCIQSVTVTPECVSEASLYSSRNSPSTASRERSKTLSKRPGNELSPSSNNENLKERKIRGKTAIPFARDAAKRNPSSHKHRSVKPLATHSGAFSSEAEIDSSTEGMKTTKASVNEPTHNCQTNTKPSPTQAINDSGVKPTVSRKPLDISSGVKMKIPKSQKVKEMHSILTNKVLRETFPRVEVIAQAHFITDAVTTNCTSNMTPLHRMNQVQANILIQAMIEDREGKRHGDSNRAKSPLETRTSRRLGSRVQMAINALGFH